MKNNFKLIVLATTTSLLVGCTFNLGDRNSNSVNRQQSSDRTTSRTSDTTSSDSAAPQERTKSSAPVFEATPSEQRRAPSSAPSSSDASSASESAAPTTIAGGQSFTWNGHGVTIIVPSDWKKATASTGQVMFRRSGSSGPTMSVDELVAKPGPVSAEMVTSDYSFQQSQMKAGKREEVKYLTIDGVRGSFGRDAASDEPLGTRGLRWKGFRTFQGRPQLISILITTTNRDYAANKTAMEQALYNVKFTE